MTVQAVIPIRYHNQQSKPYVLQYLKRLPIPYARKRDVLIEWSYIVGLKLTQDDFHTIETHEPPIQP